ncbi:MAG: response regulator transcription factor [Endozoicomonas sp.]
MQYESRNLAVEELIGHLYRATNRIGVDEFRRWALLQVNEILPFDAALWSTGRRHPLTVYTQTLVNLSDDFPDTLLTRASSNPLTKEISANLGQAFDMTDVIEDEQFYASELYQTVFAPQGIERILSSLHQDSRSGILTLLSLYRCERKIRFNEEEKALQQRLLYHLLNAASHNAFLHIERHSTPDSSRVSALCNREGSFHEVQTAFLDRLETCFPSAPLTCLPFSLPEPGQHLLPEGLCCMVEPIGELYCVDIWPEGPLDNLTQREREVVDAISQGLSFKVIARQLGLSPSTVSNHLYRVYNKLGVTSRTELAQLVKEQK